MAKTFRTLEVGVDLGLDFADQRKATINFIDDAKLFFGGRQSELNSCKPPNTQMRYVGSNRAFVNKAPGVHIVTTDEQRKLDTDPLEGPEPNQGICEAPPPAIHRDRLQGDPTTQGFAPH